MQPVWPVLQLIICRLTKKGDHFFFDTSVECDSGNALIFISYPLLKAYVEAKVVFIDGTFRSVPTMFYQLVTLHIQSFNKVNQFVKYLF